MTVFRRLKTTSQEIANRFAGSTGVDNRLLRRDGTGRTLQDSARVVDDDGCLTCGITIKSLVEAEDAAVITFDGPDGDERHVVLEGNRQLAFTNWKVGQSLLLRLIQDGTGERTVEWLGQIYWASGFPPTLTETVNHWDCVSLRCIALTEGGQPIFEGYASGFDFGELSTPPPPAGCCQVIGAEDTFSYDLASEAECDALFGIWYPGCTANGVGCDC